MSAYGPTTYLSCAETAKLLRAALKKSFPGIKFSVRSHVYAGGASINVDWTDGPPDGAVNEVAQRFAGASFDGMIDLKSYHSSELEDGTVVHHGADFVFTHREISPATQAQATEIALKNLDEGSEKPGEGYTYVTGRLPSGRFFDGSFYSMVRTTAEEMAQMIWADPAGVLLDENAFIA